MSVVLPTYRRADIIRRSIESVLTQTHRDLELIVVCDDPDDGTRKVVESIADERIRVIEREDRQGVARARNEGIKVARGTYVAFQDADDLWHPERLARQLAVFAERPHLGLVFSRARVHDERGTTLRPLPRRKQVSGVLPPILLQLNVITTASVLVRRDVLEVCGGFDPGFTQIEDWDAWIRIAARYPIEMVDEPLVDVYPMEDSLTRDTSRSVAAGTQRFFDLHEPLIRRIPRLLPRWHALLGDRLLDEGHVRQGRRMHRRAFLRYPLLWRSFVTGFLGARPRRRRRVG